MSMTDRTLWSSEAVRTCLPSGLNHATSGDLKVSPAARPPGRGNCHIFRPLGSIISTRLPPPSAISRGPGSTEGSEPGASQPAPEAVSALGPLAEVGAPGWGTLVAVLASFGQCDATPPAFAGGFAGLPAAVMSHQDPRPTPAISATSSARMTSQCLRSSGDGASRCRPLMMFLQLGHGPG